jgi:hypothetical protein
MNLLKQMKKLTTQHILLLGGIIVIVLYLTNYSSRLGSLFSGFGEPAAKEDNSVQQQQQVNNVSAAAPLGMNSGAAPANSIQTITGGPTSNCTNKPLTNPSDLLPKDNNNDFGNSNHSGSGELSNVNLLSAGFHSGIDTVGSTLRNANLQIRSEPPNPRTLTNCPWNASTIEPDTMRRGLDICT